MYHPFDLFVACIQRAALLECGMRAHKRRGIKNRATIEYIQRATDIIVKFL